MRDSLISFKDIEEKTYAEKCTECMLPVCIYTFIISCIASFTIYNYYLSINDDGSDSLSG